MTGFIFVVSFVISIYVLLIWSSLKDIESELNRIADALEKSNKKSEEKQNDNNNIG